jgi:hypothetical protein
MKRSADVSVIDYELLLETGKFSRDALVDSDFVHDVLSAVFERRCEGPRLEASLRLVVEHVSNGNLKIVRAVEPDS